MRSYLEKPHHKKRASGVAQGVGPEFKLSTTKKKNAIRENWMLETNVHYTLLSESSLNKYR
jgi:hypothetical protein